MIRLLGHFMAPEGRHAGRSKKQALVSHQEPRMSSLPSFLFCFSFYRLACSEHVAQSLFYFPRIENLIGPAWGESPNQVQLAIGGQGYGIENMPGDWDHF